MSETKIETWLEDSADAPAAIVLREYLTPVEGKDGVFFPPTFAAAENSKEFPGGYNINELANGENVCLVDTVGSQANRIEPMFATGDYAALVPQLVVEAGEKQVSILDAGHRAGDAIVRCTELQDALQKAFQSLKRGDAVPLAKLAPTSLVFGVWDSRDTQAKAPRLLAATIRAFNVGKLTRSAQYNPAVEYVEEGLLDETENKEALKAYSERGFRHVPASNTHGGVIARGDIRREVTLQIAALRLLRGTTDDETKKLRAYLLGLALVAFTKPAVGFLRQGCNLVLDGDRVPESTVVFADGRRESSGLTHHAALAFAKKAAAAFGVGESKMVKFDTKLAKDETTGEGKRGKKGKKIEKAKAG
ncbi:MAG: type I-U CRISPR-associated protein Cas7 [Gemmatimonadaceae bacterium]|nr:type I-U CRISPR-associated protein Cas7 [Gemmatimonadaceae bacterium]MCW5826771.1 type I-U CRISPR-associated protein Cas7 [Gemmatimonadaceae bacterium]